MVAKAHPGRLVFGADQTLALGAKRFSKSPDRLVARAQLQALRGRTHELHAAITFVHDGAAVFEHVDRLQRDLRRPFSVKAEIEKARSFFAQSPVFGEISSGLSVPLETAEEVLESCGRTLGNYLNYLPDGEVGDRILWVPMLAYRVFHGHPDIETLARPPRIDGVETWKPKEVKEVWQFKVKEGVKEVRFGDPGISAFKFRCHSQMRHRCILSQSRRLSAGVLSLALNKQ